MNKIKGLIIKDLLQLKSYAKTIIIFSIIFILTSLNSEDANAMEMLILMMTLGFGMLGIASFSYDELAKANKYIITFPITKKEIVLSKYILEFMLLLIGAILGICLSFTISIILNKEQIEFINEDGSLNLIASPIWQTDLLKKNVLKSSSYRNCVKQ